MKPIKYDTNDKRVQTFIEGVNGIAAKYSCECLMPIFQGALGVAYCRGFTSLWARGHLLGERDIKSFRDLAQDKAALRAVGFQATTAPTKRLKMALESSKKIAILFSLQRAHFFPDKAIEITKKTESFNQSVTKALSEPDFKEQSVLEAISTFTRLVNGICAQGTKAKDVDTRSIEHLLDDMDIEAGIQARRVSNGPNLDYFGIQNTCTIQTSQRWNQFISNPVRCCGAGVHHVTFATGRSAETRDHAIGVRFSNRADDKCVFFDANTGEWLFDNPSELSRFLRDYASLLYPQVESCSALTIRSAGISVPMLTEIEAASEPNWETARL